jgi:hypothetical protein
MYDFERTVLMEEVFRWWLTKMYHENCKEREEVGDTPFESVDAYYRTYTHWLIQKFHKENEGKK